MDSMARRRQQGRGLQLHDAQALATRIDVSNYVHRIALPELPVLTSKQSLDTNSKRAPKPLHPRCVEHRRKLSATQLLATCA